MNEVVKVNESTALVGGGIAARGVALPGTKAGQIPTEEKNVKRFCETLVELVEKVSILHDEVSP